MRTLHHSAALASTMLLLILAACGAPGNSPANQPGASQPPPAGNQRPNILLIVADDLGYSDIGVYGSEIATPNLDTLAREGVQFTQFYASPMCSTTRAMLLTGTDNHLAGLGNMAERLAENQKGQPGYEGHLNNRVATIAEVLRGSGYHTYMTGKWHLGKDPETVPAARGFDRSFALLEAGAGHFANMLPLMGPGHAEYSEDGHPVESLPDDFYSSRFYARRMLEYIESGRNDNRPFFAYLAFTAPHFPLQAPRESIARHRGAYDQGYDAIYEQRRKRMEDLGLVRGETTPFPRLTSEVPWAELSIEEKATAARTMEIYAALIDDMDRYIGEVLSYLKSHGLYQNTVVFFMSDNGAEGHLLRWGLNPLAGWAEECCDNTFENLGNADSYQMLGPNWARVAQQPFRMFKGFTSEGGIRVPAFARFPSRFQSGRVTPAFATVRDVMPTLLELAGVAPPDGQFDGREILPLQGSSMLGVLDGQSSSVHGADHVSGWEIFGKRAIRRGDWKILWETADATWWDAAAFNIRRNAWQLYNLADDPAELHDLSTTDPGRLEAMIRLWDQYAKANGVIIPDKQRGY